MIWPAAMIQSEMMWMAEQVTKPGVNMNAILRLKQPQNVSVAQKLLRLVSQDFMVRRVCTVLDQIDILCYDILCDKTSFV